VGLAGCLLLILSAVGGVAAEASPPEIPTREFRTSQRCGRGPTAKDWPTNKLNVVPVLAERKWESHLPECASRLSAAFDLPRRDAEASGVGAQRVWRRTRDGWERPSRWALPRKSPAPAVHPIVVGLLEMFLALAALLAFSGAGKRHCRAKAEPGNQPDRGRG
jgi:hypothetical protein